MMKKNRGFTLLEVLLVVAIIAILAGIVILAINPNKQLGDTRNTQRKADVNTILSAVYQYSVDNNGNLPSPIPGASSCGSGVQEICRTSAVSCSGLLDLSSYLVGTTAKYLVSMPIDPQINNSNGTNYQIYKDLITNRITVCAPNAENSITITASR
jgi:type IV pilus assembly protein PilA